MSHPDQHARLLGDVRQLVVRAREQEQLLVDLVNQLESGSSAPVAAPDGSAYSFVGASSRIEHNSALVSAIRKLCIAAREQRLMAEAVSRGLSDDSSPEPLQAGARARVLVVDDSEDTRDLTSIALTSSGLDVATAANGLDAIVAAYNLRPSVILMDINMPVLDGIEAARLLKASPVTHGVKVIAYTAKADFYEGPLTRLFVDVLAKPATPDAITARVRRLVDGSGR